MTSEQVEKCNTLSKEIKELTGLLQVINHSREEGNSPVLIEIGARTKGSLNMFNRNVNDDKILPAIFTAIEAVAEKMIAERRKELEEV